MEVSSSLLQGDYACRWDISKCRSVEWEMLCVPWKCQGLIYPNGIVVECRKKYF